MAVLGIIPSQQFELIRDRIGVILADEFASQHTLTSNNDIDVTVYNERIFPFDKTDTPCINVVFNSGNYPSKYSNKADAIYSFNIDCYTMAKTTTADEGGKKSTKNLHKILGICRAILSNSQYRTLLFAPPSLSHVEVTSINIAEPQDKNDATSLMFGRLVFNVHVTESVKLIEAIQFANSKTTVTLSETDKGYFWEVNNP